MRPRRLVALITAGFLALGSPSSAQTNVSPVAIDLELFGKSEVDRSAGCSVALWQDDRNPQTDKYAYLFIETLTGKNHAREPARINIGGAAVNMTRVATGGKAGGYGLFEYQLYQLPAANEFVVLHLSLAEEKGQSVDIVSGAMSVIMKGKPVFRALVKGNAGCVTAAAAEPPRKTGYQNAMAACQAAATAAVEAGADPPTNFKCDWKQVVNGAPGSSLTGKYAMREKGMSGEMTIVEPGDGPALIGISTVTESRNNAPTCSAEFKATRNDKSVLVAKTNEPDGCEVRFFSVPGPNTVKVTATEGCSGSCGLGGSFAGKWQRQTR